MPSRNPRRRITQPQTAMPTRSAQASQYHSFTSRPRPGARGRGPARSPRRRRSRSGTAPASPTTRRSGRGPQAPRPGAARRSAGREGGAGRRARRASTCRGRASRPAQHRRRGGKSKPFRPRAFDHRRSGCDEGGDDRPGEQLLANDGVGEQQPDAHCGDPADRPSRRACPGSGWHRPRIATDADAPGRTCAQRTRRAIVSPPALTGMTEEERCR